MTALPDNRIRYPAPEIDFTNQVGVTGQDHDSYPQKNTQARYDWMRLTLIGLLSQQSSYQEPLNFREGTPWFDMNEMALKIRKNGEWVPYSHCVLIDDGITLKTFYDEFKSLNLAPYIRFSGTSNATTTAILIPTNYSDILAGKENLYAEVFINGLLIDPSDVSVNSNVSVLLGNGQQLRPDDEYTVFIRNLDNSVVIALDEIEDAVDIHVNDLSNPHQTTALQVGADPVGSAATVQSDLDVHKAAVNPHGITAAGIGAITQVQDDTAPILGGELDANGYNIKAQYVRLFDQITGAGAEISPSLYIRSALVNFKSVAQTTIFTVPVGYQFIIDGFEVISRTVTGAGAGPTVRFGTNASPATYVTAAVSSSTSAGDRQIMGDNQLGLNVGAVSAGTVIQGGITVASGATTHTGYFVLRGFLMKI